MEISTQRMLFYGGLFVGLTVGLTVGLRLLGLWGELWELLATGIAVVVTFTLLTLYEDRSQHRF